MENNIDLTLCVNCGFAINRYVEPEAWGKIVGEDLGVRSVQFVADLLNPFLPEDYIASQVKRIKESMKKYNFAVDSIFTSAYTRVNHIMHPDADARKIWRSWFERLFKIGAELGAKSGGSHFGILSFDTYENDHKRKEVVEDGIKSWQYLSKFAKELGYECLIFEPMSVPREFANTVADSKALMDAVNSDCGIPMKICLDIGHSPHPDERNCYPWIEQLGADSPMLHVQQTVLNKSNHWPFTKEYNEQGYIDAKRVIDTLIKSGCKKSLITLELSHREHWDTDWKVVSDYKESVDYWRQYISK